MEIKSIAGHELAPGKTVKDHIHGKRDHRSARQPFRI